MKFVKLALVALAAGSFLPQAQGAEVRGRDAFVLYRLVEEVPANSAVLQILGFVTERNDPPIKYTAANAGAEFGRLVQVNNSHAELANIVRILESAGVRLRIYSGGTTFHEYLASVTCLSMGYCEVENFTPPGEQ